jgi:hypothetical protein
LEAGSGFEYSYADSWQSRNEWRMPKLKRLLVRGIAALILTAAATSDLAWAVFVRTAPPLPPRHASFVYRAPHSRNGLDARLLPVGTMDMTPGRGADVSSVASGRGLGCSAVAPRSWQLYFCPRPMALNRAQ